VRFPHRPGSGWKEGKRKREREVDPDNEFLFGKEDPQGQRCPFGAHIRRANPRESAVPDSMEQLSIVNRHRILRIGRGFKAEGSGDPVATKPGLLFMCLNGDIERQFEFIQQTWVMALQFHGLENEVDPILGRGGEKTGRLTIPTAEGPLLISGIKDFVKVRGGGYFFIPGRRALHYLCS
jgi:deferrochelatase/peroxidase EfeB